MRTGWGINIVCNKYTLSNQITISFILRYTPTLWHSFIQLTQPPSLVTTSLSHNGTTTTTNFYASFHNNGNILSLAPQECHDLFLSVQNALGAVNGEITQALAKVRSTEFMVIVTYVRWIIVLSPLLMVYSSTLHYSETASERPWTSRIFASTANGSSSVYLGGLYIFPMYSSSLATFRCRSKDSRKSVWKRRTFSDVEASKLTAIDV